MKVILESKTEREGKVSIYLQGTVFGRCEIDILDAAGTLRGRVNCILFPEKIELHSEDLNTHMIHRLQIRGKGSSIIDDPQNITPHL